MFGFRFEPLVYAYLMIDFELRWYLKQQSDVSSPEIKQMIKLYNFLPETKIPTRNPGVATVVVSVPTDLQ